MWKQFVELAKQLFTLTRKAQQHEADIKQLQQELKETRQEINQLRQEFAKLTSVVERVGVELLHDRQLAEAERKNLFLDLENRLLQSERRLPPAIEGTGNPPE